MNLVFIISTSIVGLCYLVMSLLPIWNKGSMAVTALRLSFFFCGFGHLLHAHGNLIGDHVRAAVPWDVATAVISIWAIGVMVRQRPQIFAARQ